MKARPLLACCMLAASLGCARTDSAADKVPPAEVAQPVKEQDLATVTLTEQAAERLGIVTAKVERKKVARVRVLSGEVIVPPGRTIVVSAPLAGTIGPPSDGAFPPPGTRITEGQEILTFRPLLSPEREVLTSPDRLRLAEARATLATSQIEAERQVEAAKVQFNLSETAAARAEQMLADGAGTQKALEESQAQLSLARESLISAEARNKLLAGISLDAESGELKAQPLAAPVSGTLQRIDVAPGETVGTGETLFEIVRDERLWVRVPVYVGQRRQIDDEASAEIEEFGDGGPEFEAVVAQPASAPPTADSATATVHFYYVVENSDRRFVAGQKLSVALRLRGQQTNLVVPWAAVLHDIYGGMWVYEEVAPRTFVRRRVVVKHVIDDEAILADGPEAGAAIISDGARITTDGAAELFGTELGFTK